ncbi:MAG: LppX_LprAFG lipoprotein [Ornithinibacter sp.]
MRARHLLLATVGAMLLVAGCSGGDPEPDAPAPRSAADQLAAAKTVLDGAGTVALDLTSSDVPLRENGVTAAKGSGVISETEPEFEGTITGSIQGVAGTIETIAIGETAWIKFFTPDFVETDLDTINAPNPALFFDPSGGISSLLTATTDPTDAGQVRSGSEVLTRIDGGLPGDQVETLFHLGDGSGDYSVSYGLTEGDELRTASIVGPFFPDTQATYSLTLKDYGKPVEITRP